MFTVGEVVVAAASAAVVGETDGELLLEEPPQAAKHDAMTSPRIQRRAATLSTTLAFVGPPTSLQKSR